MKKSDKLKLCVGCSDDFYNGKNDIGIKECLSLENAKVVRKWSIGWWAHPSKSAYVPVTVLSCRHCAGRVLYIDRLPDNLGGYKPPMS